MSRNKYKTVNEFFKKNAPHLKPSKALTKQLKNFRLDWSTKDSDYIDFLGSNLLGVHTINFSVLDNDKLMIDVLKIKHYDKLQDHIYEVDGIEKNFKIGSNVIYNTLTYLARAYVADRSINDKDTIEAVRELCLIMQYKMFCSTYGWFFKFNTTEPIATATYNKLSHKFLIKQLNSWQDVFQYRVDSCLNKEEINYGRLRKNDSENVIRLITDIQVKLKEQIKQIYSVMVEVTDGKDGLAQERSTFTGGESGEKQMNDVTTGINIYISRVTNIAFIPNDFIDSEALEITANLFNNIDKDAVYKFLKYMSNDDRKNVKDVLSVIEKTLLISFNYLQRNGINVENRETLPSALVAIRNYWAASKTRNEELDDVKDTLVAEAFSCTGRKTNHVNVSLMLSYIIYVFLRSLKK